LSRCRKTPYFEIISQLATGGAAPAPAPDGKNTVVFRTTSWHETPDALAYAKVWKDPGGHIIDVDIEINAVPGTMPYLLANLDPGVEPEQHDQARIDLQTLMTHEFGHFIGLAHTCQKTNPSPCSRKSCPHTNAVTPPSTFRSKTEERVAGR
jgi:hypothetical protein